MNSMYLPNQVLRKDDVDWNVSGLFVHDELLWDFIDILDTNFGVKNPIKIVHGAPPVLWNASRLTKDISKAEVNELLDTYADLGIAVYPTFSNPILKKDEVTDKQGNYILAKLNESKDNGVIVSSDILRDYVQDKYPNLKLMCSLIKSACYKGERTKEYYEELTKHYDCVVIHPDDAFNVRLLGSLEHKEKFEVMCNEVCVINCKVRGRHYRLTGLMQKSDVNIDAKIFDFHKFKCRVGRFNRTHLGQENTERYRDCHLIDREFENIYNLGFRRLKLQGRQDQSPVFLQDLVRYMLEQKYFAPLIFKTLSRRISSSRV